MGFDVPEPTTKKPTAEELGIGAPAPQRRGEKVPVKMPPEQPPIDGNAVFAQLAELQAVTFQVNLPTGTYGVVTLTPNQWNGKWQLVAEYTFKRSTLEWGVGRSPHLAHGDEFGGRRILPWPKSVWHMQQMVQQLFPG